MTPDHGNLLLSEYFGKNEKKSIVLVVDEVNCGEISCLYFADRAVGAGAYVWMEE